MRGHGHDRARAVGGEHVIGNENRNGFAVDGIHARDAFELDARLFLVQLRTLEVALAGRLLLVGLDGVGVGEHARSKPVGHELVLGTEHHVCRAEERVAPRRVHRDFRVGLLVPEYDAEIHQRARGFSDPVALHFLDAFRPVELVEIGQETLGVFGDLQHPLAHRSALHGMVSALGAAVNDFFVREHRSQGRTPVHGHFGDVGETLLVELLEYPLRPAVVLRIRRVDFAVPVVRKAEHADLLAETVDVLLRRDRRVRARFHGVLLGRQTKRVPPHRMEDVEALHALVAAQDVGRRITLGMPHVKSRTARIREHVQTVELGFARAVVRGFECLLVKPTLLPLLLDRRIIVVHLRYLTPWRVLFSETSPPSAQAPYGCAARSKEFVCNISGCCGMARVSMLQE